MVAVPPYFIHTRVALQPLSEELTLVGYRPPGPQQTVGTFAPWALPRIIANHGGVPAGGHLSASLYIGNHSTLHSYSGTCLSQEPLLVARLVTCLPWRNSMLSATPGDSWHLSLARLLHGLRPPREDRPTPEITLSRGYGSDSGRAPFTYLALASFPASSRLLGLTLPSG